MKHIIFKSFLVLALVVTFGIEVTHVYASEVTGTLSTIPEDNNKTTTTTSNSVTKTNTSTASDSTNTTSQGGVIGGEPIAQAGEYGSTESTPISETRDTSAWIWIAIPAILLIGALVYVFSRPSHR